MLIATTTVSVKRPDGSGDPYEAATTPTIQSRVAAHISAPSGTEANVGGALERVDAVALLPQRTDVRRADIVVDELTARAYRVGTVVRRTGLGLDHVKATLTAVAGGNNG